MKYFQHSLLVFLLLLALFCGTASGENLNMSNDKPISQQAMEMLMENMMQEQDVQNIPPIKNKGLSPLSQGILWGGAAADLGSTMYKLQDPRYKEGNSLYGKNPSNWKLAAGKVGANALAHILLNKLAQKGENEKATADKWAKIFGIGQGGLGLLNMLK